MFVNLGVWSRRSASATNGDNSNEINNNNNNSSSSMINNESNTVALETLFYDGTRQLGRLSARVGDIIVYRSHLLVEHLPVQLLPSAASLPENESALYVFKCDLLRHRENAVTGVCNLL
jgi:hypothetical protein